MRFEFSEGKTYEAIPTLRGARRRLIVCVGRVGCRVSFAWAEDLTVEKAQVFDADREIVKACRPDGEYVISSATPLDTHAGVVLMDLIRNKREVCA